MIKANELRIGNWYKNLATGTYSQVDLFLFSNILEEEAVLDYVLPLKLTPNKVAQIQWPEFCQYRIFFNADSIKKYGDAVYWLQSVGLDLLPNGLFVHQVVYVHQLQNLYFALTGEELQYNPQTKIIYQNNL